MSNKSQMPSSAKRPLKAVAVKSNNAVPGNINADKMKQGMAMIVDKVRKQMEAETLIKPDTQIINDVIIEWTWDSPETSYHVVSRIIKSTKEYQVQAFASSEDPVLTAAAAEVLGNQIVSAGKWVDLWKQHAGEYLISDGTEVVKDS